MDAPPTPLECLLAVHLPPGLLGEALALLAHECRVAYELGQRAALDHLRAHLADH